MKFRLITCPLLLCSVLFFGTLSAALAADDSSHADFIIYNAKVITVNSNFSVAQAVAVRGSQILAVGKQMDHYKGPKTRMIDAHEHTVMPGLYDNDVYSYEAAVSEINPPPATFKSLAEAFAYIRQQAAAKPLNTWITVSGVFPTRASEGRLPSLAELDAVAPKHPVAWECGPVVMINSKAIEFCRITSHTANPPGGEIVRDPVTLKPTGLLRNAASVLHRPVPRPPTTQERNVALRHLYQLYNEQGITSITESKADPVAIDLFRDLEKSGELTVRINCLRPIEPAATIEESLTRLTALAKAPPGKLPYGPTGAGDDWVRIGPLKTMIDGDVLLGTAYMRTPWGIGPTYQITEPAYRGDLYHEDGDILTAIFNSAARQGWQVSADCTGDAALDKLLNCYEKVQFKTDIRERRFMINHASFQAEQDWERCQQLGLVATLQPAWLYCDAASLAKTLGSRRLRNFMSFNSWFENQIPIGGGSHHTTGLDANTANNPWNPWLGLWITLARQTQSGVEVYPKEKLTRKQAIQFYTINNAYLNFEEKKKGSLEPGKFADLIIIDNDLLKCPEADIRNTKVLLTMVGGKIVWEAK